MFLGARRVGKLGKEVPNAARSERWRPEWATKITHSSELAAFKTRF